MSDAWRKKGLIVGPHKGKLIMKTKMMMAALALMTTGGAAQAEINDKTRCSEFVATSNAYERATNASNKIFNKTEEGRKLQEYYLFMDNVMDGLDIDHVQAGKPGIMASLSDDGRQKLTAAAAVQCRNHQNMTVWNAAAFVYRAIRDMEMELGTAK
jgi:hypothetical protein